MINETLSKGFNYTDVHGLEGLRDLTKKDSEQGVDQVSKQFEALFVQMMIKSMRDASPQDELFESSQMEFYEEWYDKQLALQLSQGEGIGLAKSIKQQLQLDEGEEVSQSLKTRELLLERPLKFSNFSLNQLDVASLEPTDVKLEPIPIPSSIDMGSYIEPVLTIQSPQEFIQEVYPHAQKAAEKLGVSPEILIAQVALETGWGKHVVEGVDGETSNNLFSIKAGSDWLGNTIRRGSKEFLNGRWGEFQSDFRAYPSIEKSFEDYVEFLQNNQRYQSALNSDSDESFINQLQNSGYATDPNYARKIIAITERTGFRKQLASYAHQGLDSG